MFFVFTCSYESQTVPVKVKRDTATEINFTLKIMDPKEWSAKKDFGIMENVDTHSFTEVKAENLQGFSADNFDIVEYNPTEKMHHLKMTDQV